MPIALTPLNLLLLLLMLASPWLGKFCRESLEKSSRSEEIQRIASRNSRKVRVKESKDLQKLPNTRKKVVSTLKRIEQQQSKEHKLIAQAQNKAEKPVKPGQAETKPIAVLVNQPPQGEQLLVSMKEELKAPARSLTKTPSLSKKEKKKIFYRKIKEYAKAKDFKKAEEAFLEQLEGMSLSPLESLEKQARFKQHFEKLTTHVKPKSS